MSQEQDFDAQSLTLLPTIEKRAIWDERSGLIVSPFNRPLPLEIADGLPTTPSHYLKPRLLEDKLFYLAFYPKSSIAQGALFDVLSIGDEELRCQIVLKDERWALNEETITSWANLETLMLGICITLINKHELYAYLPTLAFPNSPESAGYRNAHPELEDVMKSARRSLQQFTVLSSLVTFAIMLWINPHREDAFDRAFSCLRDEGFNAITLQHLKDSGVCDLSPYFRTGGFLDALKTRWARLVYRIGRGGAPIWFIWGEEGRYMWDESASRTMKDEFFPPLKWIAKAQREVNNPHPVILPQSRPSQQTAPESRPPTPPADYGDITTPFDDDPIPPPPKVVEKNSRQRPGESFVDFQARMLEGLARARQRDAKYKAVIDSKEAQAKQINRGVAPISRKSKCFVWLQDEYHKDYFVRSLLDHPRNDWEGFTAYQRIYWPQVDEWDLVRQIPRYPSHVPLNEQAPEVEDLDDLDDPSFNLLHSKPPPQFAIERSKQADDAILAEIRANAQKKVLGTEYKPQHFTFPLYLLLRHGFNIEALHNQSGYLWDNTATNNVKIGQSAVVSRRLGFSYYQEPAHDVSIVDMYNSAIGVGLADKSKKLSLSTLPPNWDISREVKSASWGLIDIHIAVAAPYQDFHFVATKHTLNYAMQSKLDDDRKTNLYVMRPSPSSKDKSSWFVATTDPTTVLFVFRKGLTTMHSIAQDLLERGIPFRTVEERLSFTQTTSSETPKANGEYHTTQDGKWTPKEDDFIAYISARDELFKSYLGRSIRARGGLIGRLASEVVPDVEVLSGPVRCDEVVGHGIDGRVFVDDLLPESKLEIVVGVQRIVVGKRVMLNSWWPMVQRWNASGGRSDHWTPDAEQWYLKRLTLHKDKVFEVLPPRVWKSKTRWDKNQQIFLLGCRRIAAEFISGLAKTPSSSSSS